MQNLDKNISTIVIIGNGFDLNQGLKTSYTDFVKSSDFNILTADQNNQLAIYLKEKHHLQNWIDIENELTKYSNEVTSTTNFGNLSNNNFQQEFNKLSLSLMNYLDKNIEYKIAKNTHSYKLLSKILDDDFLILDFNYTNTVFNILTELGLSKEEIKDRHIKVHGSINEKQIIFGVEDGANIKSHHVFLRKAFNRNFKSLNINTQLENLTNLYLFGHSLGSTDHMYFKDFFFKISLSHDRANKIINLYHYGNDGYTQLLEQIDKLTMNHLTGFRQCNTIKFIDTSIY
jgi:hypothetical protein